MNNQAGGKSEDKAQGTHLNALIVILGNQSRQRAICNVVRSVEHSVEHGVGKEEEQILRCVTPFHGNGEDSYQTDTVADVGPEHPRTGFAHLGVGLVDHCTEENIGNAIENL